LASESLALVTGRQRCSATKKDGTPCQAFAVRDGLCVGHLPNAIEARRRGGYNSSKRARLDAMLPSRLRPVLVQLEESITGVRDGDLSARQGQAIAALAGAVVRVYEAGVLEERLLALETRLGVGDSQRRW